MIMPIGYPGKDFLSESAQAEIIEHLHQQLRDPGQDDND
jgi:hypothetical protein